MELLKVGRENFREIIKKAMKFIKEGNVLICPTDTVYGLIADATNKKAVERLFKIKKRTFKKPIPIFVKDIKTVKRLALINKEQESFLTKVWPGKVTVVLKRLRLRRGFGGRRKNLYGVDKKTIALRIPNYRFLNILLEKLNRPLIGTSANISGYPASTKIEKVIEQFKNKKMKPDLILSDGNLKPSRPSAIIDLTGKKQKILRKGEIKIYAPKN